MGEKLLCSHFSPVGEILLYSSFSGGKYYYGGKNYSTTPVYGISTLPLSTKAELSKGHIFKNF